jgi:hypothetical protein
MGEAGARPNGAAPASRNGGSRDYIEQPRLAGKRVGDDDRDTIRARRALVDPGLRRVTGAEHAHAPTRLRHRLPELRGVHHHRPVSGEPPRSEHRGSGAWIARRRRRSRLPRTRPGSNGRDPRCRVHNRGQRAVHCAVRRCRLRTTCDWPGLPPWSARRARAERGRLWHAALRDRRDRLALLRCGRDPARRGDCPFRAAVAMAWDRLCGEPRSSSYSDSWRSISHSRSRVLCWPSSASCSRSACRGIRLLQEGRPLSPVILPDGTASPNRFLRRRRPAPASAR